MAVNNLSAALTSLPLTYSALADKTIGNSTVKTSGLSPSCLGSLVLPPNKLALGTIVEIRGSGLYTIPSVAPGQVDVESLLNSTVIANTNTSGITTLIGGSINAAFDFAVDYVVRSIGVSGKVTCSGGLNFAYGNAGDRVFLDMLNGGNEVTVDTTISQTVDVKVKWSTASSDRVVRVTQSSIRLRS